MTAKLQSTLHLFDLIVGTEEEFHIAGGSTDTIAALRAVRAVSAATLVCKRGPMGAAAFTGAIPDSLDDGERGPGFPIEVFNVLGAGDGFMSGPAQGLADRPGLADGADIRQRLRRLRRLAPRLHPGLSVLGGAAVLPRPRRQDQGAAQGRRARADPLVDQPAAATGREMRVFAFDHRMQLEAVADELEAPHERIGAFKRALPRGGAARSPPAGPATASSATAGSGATRSMPPPGTGLWIGRPVELPGSRPLRLEAEIEPDYGSALAEWPLEHVVKVLVLLPPGRRRRR